jgi:hypothetical protein
MAGENDPRQVTSVNAPFLATVAWFAVLTTAVLVVSSRPDVPALFPFAAVAVIAAVMPMSLIAAWRLGKANPDAQDRRMMELIQSVRRLGEEGGLSEGAKRVLHRRRERDLLRQAIEQDIAAEDWDAAMVLVKELAESFGYRADAEEFRTRVERARAQTLDRKVVEALAQLDEHIRNRRWAESYAEAARIQRLYPESHRVDGLRARIDQARYSYRKDLERRFLIAADSDQLDGAIELLRELDGYLTPTEAGPLQEVARGVIGKVRDNLGARFKLSVSDHRWDEAVQVGTKIMADFPNTRMAQEVSEMMPMLRDRVAGRAASRA